jgi:anthranilate phosphoribosyltransferase
MGLETGIEGVLDTCGTGGDGLRTFNISTAAAFVVAAAGLPVVKHGNRAISGSSGSADVLTELGVSIVAGPEVARRCLGEANMAFCMAPLYHPALRRAAEVRKRLGVRTIFNQLGPLCNPASAPYQLLGVGRPEWQPHMASALARLGVRRALLVHAEDGLDEVSLGAETAVYRVEEGRVSEERWLPEDFGLRRWPVEALRADGPVESARAIRSVLAGEPGPALDVVLANAAAALLAGGAAGDLQEGTSMAQEAVRSGKASAVLATLSQLTAQD